MSKARLGHTKRSNELAILAGFLCEGEARYKEKSLARLSIMSTETYKRHADALEAANRQCKGRKYTLSPHFSSLRSHHLGLGRGGLIC